MKGGDKSLVSSRLDAEIDDYFKQADEQPAATVAVVDPAADVPAQETTTA